MPRPGIGIIVLDEEVAAGLGAVGVVIEKVIPDTEAERASLEGIDYRRRTLGGCDRCGGGDFRGEHGRFYSHPAKL